MLYSYEKDVSIEDGFAMKHTSDKTRGKKRKVNREDCTIPSEPAKHILSTLPIPCWDVPSIVHTFTVLPVVINPRVLF